MRKLIRETGIDDIIRIMKSACNFNGVKSYLDSILDADVYTLEYFGKLQSVVAEVSSIEFTQIKCKTCELYYKLLEYIADKFSNLTFFDVSVSNEEEISYINAICCSVIMDVSHALNVLMNIEINSRSKSNIDSGDRARKIKFSIENTALAVLNKYSCKNEVVLRNIDLWTDDIVAMASANL